MPNASLILPFTVLDKNRKEKFDANMEFAAILALAEAERKKHGMIGFTPEKTMFVSKLHYPFWAVPWENKCLIIDGLQLFSSPLTYTVLPDLELFLNDIERGQTIREQFRNALNKHAQTFADFAEVTPTSINTIVDNKVLLADFAEYVDETLTSKADVEGNIALLSPKLDEIEAGENAQKVFALHEQIQSDIKGLEHASRTLNQLTQFHQQKILHEIELVKEALTAEIGKIKPVVEKKIELLLKARDKQIEKMNKTAERELNTRAREKERLRHELERLELQRTEYRRRLELRKGRRDRVGEARWEHSLRACENKISEAKERIDSVSRFVEKTQRQHLEDVDKLKYSFQALIEGERKKLADIQASFQLVISAKEDEKEKLGLLTTHLVSLIEQLAEQKKLHADALKDLTISWQPEQVTLLGVPFYAVVYKTEENLRYNVYPPFKVMSPSGIVKKIEKTLLSFRLASRIQLLLQPKSKMFDSMFNVTFEEKIRTDETLEENLQRLCESNNLLVNQSFRETLSQGLEELKAEGWIKQEESSSLMKTYGQVGH